MGMFPVDVTGSPAYVFDLDNFADRCKKVKSYLGDISLTYSMKANPFLLNGVPETIGHVEVCSPGELAICKKMGIAPNQIIYSGVTKEQWDVESAVSYGVDILTAESLLHAQLENDAVLKLRAGKDETRKVILRLTSGNQFGMSEEDICTIIENRQAYPGLDIFGIHFYSGTQKKMRQITKDFAKLEKLLVRLKENYNYEPRLIEYGPGACVDYFEEPYNETDWAHFEEVTAQIKAFAENYPIGIEMGRFLASDCGSYVTQVKDSKRNTDTNYLILDGGIHHLKYHGQTMAMQIPPIDVIRGTTQIGTGLREASEQAVPYMLCGSLCTVADVLVREVHLPDMEIGDYLVFHRCGAYSVTEGTVLFLSRTMPRIFVKSEEKGLRMIRDFVESGELNCKV